MSHPPQQLNSKKAEQQCRKGLTFLKERKLKKAIPLLKEALELNPSNKEAQVALQDALEGVNWNPAYFCKNCGAFIKPEKSYPEIKFDGLCPRCDQKNPTELEKSIGFAELSIKLILFGIFPIATLVFCISPMYTIKWGGAYLELAPILSAIFTAMNLTPLFILLFSVFSPGYSLSKEALYWFYDILNPLEMAHPVLFFTAEIAILFVVVYLSFLFILTPIIYIHRKGYWRSKEHQKRTILITSIYVALVVLRRLSAGVFE